MDSEQAESSESKQGKSKTGEMLGRQALRSRIPVGETLNARAGRTGTSRPSVYNCRSVLQPFDCVYECEGEPVCSPTRIFDGNPEDRIARRCAPCWRSSRGGSSEERSVVQHGIMHITLHESNGVRATRSCCRPRLTHRYAPQFDMVRRFESRLASRAGGGTRRGSAVVAGRR